MFSSVLYSIKNKIQKNRTMLLILIFTQIATLLCVYLSYGISVNANAEQVKADDLSTTFYISLASSGSPDIEPVYYRFSECREKIDRIAAASGNEWVYCNCYGVIDLDGKTFSVCGIEPNFNNSMTDKPEKFEKTDYMTGNNVIAVNTNAIPCEKSSIIQMDGGDYSVSETDSSGLYAADIIMPYKSLPDSSRINEIYIYLGDVPTKELVDCVAAQIETEFGFESQTYVPEVPDLLETQFNRLALFITAAACVIILLNLCYLYSYIIDKDKKTFYTYKIVGCSPRTAVINFICEINAFFVISIPVSILIYKYTFCPVLDKYFNFFNELYTARIFCMLIAGYLLIDFIIKTYSIVPNITKKWGGAA